MARKIAKPAISKQLPPSRGGGARRSVAKKTKKQTCLKLLGRSKGATLAELGKATGWQAHSVRGFLSGTVRKIEGIGLATDIEPGQPRRYRITASAEKA